MKKNYLIVLLAICKIGYCQIQNQKDLLIASRAYYRNLKTFFVQVNVKNKTSISEDTAKASYQCFIDKPNNNQLFFISNSNGLLVNKTSIYLINSQINQFEKVKKSKEKFTIFSTRYCGYPFVRTDDFFDELEKAKFMFQVLDSSYLLKTFSLAYEFRKADFSLKKVTESYYDFVDKGNFFEETWFGKCDSTSDKTETEINNAYKILKHGKKRTAKPVDNKQPTTFELAFLKTDTLKLVNYSGENVRNKILLFDFFYEGCLPCVESFPILNQFYSCHSDSLLIIGIDPQLSDTSNIQRFIERYNIKYPVLIGSQALELNDRLKDHGFPTFLVVNSNGKILEFQNGHSEKFFKKVKSTYLKNKCN